MLTNQMMIYTKVIMKELLTAHELATKLNTGLIQMEQLAVNWSYMEATTQDGSRKRQYIVSCLPLSIKYQLLESEFYEHNRHQVQFANVH